MWKVVSWSLLGMIPGIVQGCGVEAVVPDLPAPSDPNAATVRDDVLARWARKSAEVRSIRARFAVENRDPAFDRTERLRGWYAWHGRDKARLDLADERGGTPRLIARLSLNDHKMTHLDGKSHHVWIFQAMDRDERDRAARSVDGIFSELNYAIFAEPLDLLDPDGPSLFLTMDVESALRRYRIDLMEETPTQYVLRFAARGRPEVWVAPLAEVTLDKATLLPRTVKANAGGHQSRTIRFETIEVNPEVPAGYFATEIPKGWTIEHMSDLRRPNIDPAGPRGR